MAEEAGHNGSADSAPRSSSGVMKLVKAIAFVSVIVLLEVAAAMAILPTPEETRQIGVELASDEEHPGENGEGLSAVFVELVWLP